MKNTNSILKSAYWTSTGFYTVNNQSNLDMITGLLNQANKNESNIS